ncbi:MAG: sigma-70 family RNA polymerase sigma factor [Chloroflexi bacterium]|nr:sigma-70 family RNA polymerase sigma factor [Chloroflexota bacterium]
MDETEAVRLCQEGHESAFQVIVERYGDVMYGTAVLMTHDRALAEDLVQDALMLAWKGFSRFRAGSNLKAWLMRILVNRVISDRRRKRVDEVEMDASYNELVEPGSTIQTVISAEEAERIRAALLELPFEPRQAVVLRFYAGMTIPEIAETLGWREGTVKSRLHRALRQLKDVLESQPDPVTLIAEEC